MTRVLTSAQQAEATAEEYERDRVAWNLPRKPVGADSHASYDSQAVAAQHDAPSGPRRVAARVRSSKREDQVSIGTEAVAAWEDEGGGPGLDRP
jgi:hypothetical protein